MKKVDKTKLCIFVVMRLSVVVAAVLAVIDGNWMYFGMSILTLIVMLLPSVIEKRFKIDIPDEFEIVLVVFVYAAIFLGEMQQFYDKVWWWDKMLHSFSGLILGNVGFLIISYLNSNKKIDVSLSPVFVAFFTFCFAVAMGAVWEIYEFSMDKSFGFHMQRNSLNDTMTDIILDTIGALVFAFLGYLQQKGKINIISKCIVKFKITQNQRDVKQKIEG